MMLATISGLSFSGADGDTTYTIESMSGWLDGLETRHERVERPDQDGEFDIPGYLSGRVVTWSGLISTMSDTEYEQAIQALSAISPTTLSTLSVETALGETTAEVRRFGKPDVSDLVYGRSARYQIRFWSPDHRRYGATHTPTPGSSVTGISHDGNYPATPVLEVSGSAAGYTVTGPGSALITVTTALVSGHPHTLNLDTGGLYVDGARVLGGVTVYEPWTVPVGGSVSASVSAGSLSVTVRDTFV